MPILPVLLLLLGAPAASPPASEEVRAVSVTVLDEKGAPVEGLGPEEVAVVENGAARTVTRFERDRRGLTVAILVDSSEPAASFYRQNVVEAVLQFIKRLPEGSKVSVWTTGDRPAKIVDYDDPPEAAGKALRRTVPTGGNTLLDALVEASRDLKGNEAGRGFILAVTGSGIGFANYHRQQVVEEVLKSPATVLGVQIEEARAASEDGSAQDSVGSLDYDYVLTNLAEATGGRRERVLSAMGVGRVLDSLAADLRGQYRVSYLTAPGAKSRKVEVKVARPGVKVRIGSARP